MGLRMHRQVGALRKVLSQQAIGILVRPALPRLCGSALYFKGYHPIEHVHPLEGGALRLKSRHERRPHLPVEPASLFYPRYFVETAIKAVRWATLAIRLERLARTIRNGSNIWIKR
jgi:hypothetical protein